MTEKPQAIDLDRKPKKCSWVATTMALVIAAGGLLVVNLTGWGNFFALALAGVILFFIAWALYSQFDWRRAQVSLSTALVLMFVTRGLLWANTRPNDRKRSSRCAMARLSTIVGWIVSPSSAFSPTIGLYCENAWNGHRLKRFNDVSRNVYRFANVLHGFFPLVQLR